MARGTISGRAESSSLAIAQRRKLPENSSLCIGLGSIGRGHMGPWVGDKHTDFQQLALLLPPTAEKGQESCVWKNTRPSRHCQESALFLWSGSSAEGPCWIGTMGFPCLSPPWFTQGLFLPQMEAQLVEILLVHMRES